MRTLVLPRRLRLGRLLATLGVAFGAFVVAAHGARAADEVVLPPPLTATQLDDLVAPVALYPDQVLDVLLPASTRPDEVRAAAGFLVRYGERANAAPEDARWDASVVALLQVPDVLRWLGENPAWVERLGYAVLIQQSEVLDAVQRYRTRAYELGALTSNAYMNVRQQQHVIYVESLSPSVVYVPVYDPWALQRWSPGVSFFTSWFGFSFGISGYWTSHRIAWGAGIYGYASPYWYGGWRSSAGDWGSGRPTRWSGVYGAEQPWARAGWSRGQAIVRPTAPRSLRTSVGARDVRVAPPPRRHAPERDARAVQV